MTSPKERGGGPPREVVIVASRLKEYVRARSGFNTSDRVLDPLSEIVRRICDQAIENARSEGRRTVLDRDIPDAYQD
jgi:histone H3/H4